MLDLSYFLAQPESAAIFIKELKAGKITMKWEDILADDEKFSNLQELTFGLMMQAIDNIQSLQSEKLAPLIGKIFTLTRQLETAVTKNDATKITSLTGQFETALREFAGLINVEQAIESIRSLQNADESMFDPDLTVESPLCMVILGLKMLVNAHELPPLDNDDVDDTMHECDEDECEL